MLVEKLIKYADSGVEFVLRMRIRNIIHIRHLCQTYLKEHDDKANTHLTETCIDFLKSTEEHACKDYR
jgi:serine/threonine protein kinase HipA of HipAB toxin-antitoxin module